MSLWQQNKDARGWLPESLLGSHLVLTLDSPSTQEYSLSLLWEKLGRPAALEHTTVLWEHYCVRVCARGGWGPLGVLFHVFGVEVESFSSWAVGGASLGISGNGAMWGELCSVVVSWCHMGPSFMLPGLQGPEE